jgi:anti-sigma regulatory factor (Ser/Thr protein kinase)
MPTMSQHDRPQEHQLLAREKTYTYPARKESVRKARAQLFKTLCDWGFELIADDLILCLSEAVTNALLYGTPGQEVTVHVRAMGTTVHIEVDDCDDDAEPQIQVPPEVVGESTPALADVAAGGRGVLLITMLSDAWGVRWLTAGKAVWFERDASRAAGA